MSSENERTTGRTAANLRRLAAQLRSQAARALADGDPQTAAKLHELALAYERMAERLDQASEA
jgi:hypothetical protein